MHSYPRKKKKTSTIILFSKVIQTVIRLGYIVLGEKNIADEISIKQLILLCDCRPMAEEDTLPPQNFT